jgi:hypothetical protein
MAGNGAITCFVLGKMWRSVVNIYMPQLIRPQEVKVITRDGESSAMSLTIDLNINAGGVEVASVQAVQEGRDTKGQSRNLLGDTGI